MLCFFVSVFSGLSHADEAPKVLLLPFDIQAQTDPGYLQSEIDKIISGFLEKNGAVVLEVESRPDASAGPEEYRNIGKAAEASHVVWGAGKWKEGQYDIQAHVLETATDSKPSTLTVQGSGPENLLPLVQSLARDINSHIFKQERIADLIISGNSRIEEDAIKKRIKTKAGDSYLQQNLTKDLKNVYAMGYFEDVRIEYDNSPEGKIVVFHVTEKPTIRKINIEGNDAHSVDDIKQHIEIHTGSVFNLVKLKKDIKKIKSLYKEKNYHNAAVTYSVEALENNQTDLTITIEEGNQAKIQKIIFEGNHAFSPEELQELKKAEAGLWNYRPFKWLTDSSELGEMSTTEEDLFSFINDSGELNMEKLNQDTAKLEAFYHNNGFVDARVAEPEIAYEGDAITIKFKIDEGPRYTVNQINLEGDLIRPKEALLKRLKIKQEEPVSREVLRKDVLALTDTYANKGFFYADIFPRIDRNPEQKTADITFVMKKGSPVTIEKILITGNTSTRDKVIRRELPIHEQELYNGRRLKRGVRNLHRLDFFEDVKVDTPKGSAADKMILKIDVKDKPTGAFSFGGGYSSIEQLFVTASITERNLLGRGQILRLNGEVGGRTSQFDLSFTEPWLFDIPLSASSSIYNVKREYDYYTKKSTGGSQGFGYPVFDYTRLSLSYGYEQNEYTQNDEEDTSIVDIQLEDFVDKGRFVLSKMTTSLQYDSRDSAMNPTEGSQHSLSITHAGGPFRGDYGFTQYLVETGWYYPLFWSTVGFLHGEAGYIGLQGPGMPTDEFLFALGGMNSVRGFKWRSLGPKYPGTDVTRGGNKYVQFNVEYIFPLLKKAGLNGVLFLDSGNAFGEGEGIDFGNLRKSAGAGIRWNSPLGPIRIEYGMILDLKEDEDSGRWEFAMGSAF